MGLLIAGTLKEARIGESGGRTYYNLIIEELKYNGRGDLTGTDRFQVNALEESYPEIKKYVGQHVVLHIEAEYIDKLKQLRYNSAALANLDVLVSA